MTATSGTSIFDADGDEPEFASLCAQARDLAESGHLKRAAQLYERVLEGGSEQHRGRAALGLAVVRHDLGDPRAARRADRMAIETGHPEFAPRAAYHLALMYEEEGAGDEAAEAWRAVLNFENDRYAAAAHYGLARIAEERGEPESALPYWERVLESGTPDVLPEAAHDFAGRLLARGENETATEVIVRGLEVAEHSGLRLLLGAVHVERAIDEFGAVVDAARPDPEGGSSVDPGTAGAAVEMLAKLLAMRGDPDQAEQVWEHGLTGTGSQTAGEVRSRLRRGFLEPTEDENEERGDEGTATWWDPYVEAAVAQDSSAMLTGELFVALSQMYTHLAAPLAGNESRVAALHQAMADAVRTPSEYVWGRSLHDDFRARLREAAGSDTDVLPEGWPDS
ncbi:tetratricopeptide (TPR) repeat protein [Lipingzhangella halophila]|uniref:Tetratricopeptide (TPR) repeat protein n=1 Tax=Lipingzhangella halophila TaxID=1783352 RepID=A0A7W7W2J3_9ACTN|nr:tetratricopeptide repeat protein [Lipingzhangella halophila]MBB4931513.1 tetratricopeptide (TPR) repeat protein [Lipingzhangella halophila]